MLHMKEISMHESNKKYIFIQNFLLQYLFNFKQNVIEVKKVSLYCAINIIK